MRWTWIALIIAVATACGDDVADVTQRARPAPVTSTADSAAGNAAAPPKEREHADRRARLDLTELPPNVVVELDGIPLSGVVVMEPGDYALYLHVDGVFQEQRDVRLHVAETLVIEAEPLLTAAAEASERRERHLRVHPDCGGVHWQAVAWLMAHRMPDGTWDAARFTERCDHEPVCDGGAPGVDQVEATALAVLPLLAEGNTHVEGSCRVALREALDQLAGGRTAEGLLAPGVADETRVHALATLTFTELLRAQESPRYRRIAQPAVEQILASRRPHGGWARTSAQAVVAPLELSATAFAILALDSAAQAGLTLPETWRDDVADDLVAAGEPGRPELSARDAALLTLAHLVAGRPADDPAVIAGMERVLGEPPVSDDLVRLWASTSAVFRWTDASPAGRDAWKRWNRGLEAIDAHRWFGGEESGSAGSVPLDARLGRVRSVAWAALVQAVYYRYGRVLGVTRD